MIFNQIKFLCESKMSERKMPHMVLTYDTPLIFQLFSFESVIRTPKKFKRFDSWKEFFRFSTSKNSILWHNVDYQTKIIDSYYQEILCISGLLISNLT